MSACVELLQDLNIEVYDDWRVEVYSLFGFDEAAGDNGKSHAVMRLAG